MTPLHPGHYATRQSYQMIGLDLQPTLDAMDGCIRRWTTSHQKMKINPFVLRCRSQAAGDPTAG